MRRLRRIIIVTCLELNVVVLKRESQVKPPEISVQVEQGTWIGHLLSGFLFQKVSHCCLGRSSCLT